MPTTTPQLDRWAEAEVFAKRWAAATADWFADNLVIIDRQETKVPLLVNWQQRQVLFWVGMQIAFGVPIRLIVLKARRVGISTAITGLLTYMTVTRPNYSAWVIAHHGAATNMLGQIAKRYRDWMPPQYQRELTRDNQRQVIYSPPHDSSLTFATAGGQGGEHKAGVGRSFEATGLHISEMAFIDNWAEVSAGLLATVPKNYRWSIVAKESSANGAQGAFYDDWNRSIGTWAEARAKRVVTGTIPLFFSWLDFPEYQTPVPEDYEWGEFDEWEDELAALGATNEQLYWRRHVLADDFNGDPERFAQEYPATPTQAFRESGRPAIPARTIAHHQEQVDKAGPGEKVVLVRDLVDGHVQAEPADGTEPWYWIIDERPRERHWYCAAGDVAEGKAADPADVRSDLDRHAGAMLDRREQRFVAHGCGKRIDADEFGWELRKLCEWYNMAWGTPEVNNAGLAAMIAFRDYPFCYEREKGIESTDEGEAKPLRGYKVTPGNRTELIDWWKRRTRYHPDTHWEGQLVVCSQNLVNEERTFIRRKDGKQEHAPGEFDDELFAHMICAWIDDHLPEGLSDATPRQQAEETRAGAVRRSSEAYVGGVDPVAARDLMGSARELECG